MKETSKYYPLYLYFKNSDEDVVTLMVADVQSIVGGGLPASARSQRAWWSNRKTAVAQSSAWIDAGYRVDKLELEKDLITFRKIGTIPELDVQRKGDIVMWNSDMIKALREHMGMNQGEFAKELGVRQPTISEWETGAYEPKRSTSKFLTMIAEQAEFTYE